MMPRFFKDMPNEQEGLFAVGVIKTCCGYDRVVFWSKHKFRCKRQAYFAARFITLWYSVMFIPTSWGVIWCIGKNEK